jgi:hypothetical protein
MEGVKNGVSLWPDDVRMAGHHEIFILRAMGSLLRVTPGLGLTNRNDGNTNSLGR